VAQVLHLSEVLQAEGCMAGRVGQEQQAQVGLAALTGPNTLGLQRSMGSLRVLGNTPG
jgi:hypothetical protein